MTKKQLVARCLDCALVGSVFGMVAPSQSCRGGCPVLYFAAAAGHPQAEQALPALAMITVVMTIVAAVLRRGEGNAVQSTGCSGNLLCGGRLDHRGVAVIRYDRWREGARELQPAWPSGVRGGWGLLLSLNHGAVGRSRFPCPRIIDPGVAAYYGSRSMSASEFSVVGKCVM
jgi:hypothetical protein